MLVRQPAGVLKRLLPRQRRSAWTVLCGTALATLVVHQTASAQSNVGGRGQQRDSSRASVTATRVEDAPLSPIASGQVLTASELRRRGINRLVDALRLVAGLHVVEAGSPGSPVSLYMRGGERDHVLVLVDGMPVSEPGGRVNLAHVQIDNIHRIEVVRGPASALYGSDAVAGVVQIFTMESTNGLAYLDGATTFGSHETRGSHASFASSGRSGAVSLGYATYRTNGITDRNDQYGFSNYSGALRLRLSEGTSLGATARYSDAAARIPTKLYGDPIDPNSYNTENRFLTRVSLRSRLAETLESEVNLSYVLQNVVVADPPDDFTPLPFISDVDSDRRRAGTTLHFRGVPNAVFSAGAEYESQRSSFRWVDSPVRNPLLERWNRAGFVQGMARSEQGMDLVLGARIDDNQRFGDVLTWRVAGGIPVDSIWRLRGSLGTAFREPSFHELVGIEIAMPNAVLAPERVRGWDLALERSLSAAGGTVSVSYFRQRVDDMIELVAVEDPGTFPVQHRNVGSARVAGWELQVASSPVHDVHASASVTFLHARSLTDEPEDGARLWQRPSESGTASLVWRASEGFLLGTDVSYVGRRTDERLFADGSALVRELGGYAKVDLFSGFVVPPTILNDFPLGFTVRVANVLNRRYQAIPGFQTTARRLYICARVNVTPF